jgi:hypothetical protein
VRGKRSLLASIVLSATLLLSNTRVSQAQSAAPAPRIQYATPQETAERQRHGRQELLKDYVGRYVSKRNVDEGFGYAFAAIGGLGLFLGAASFNHDQRLAISWTTGFGASTAAVFASAFASRDTRIDVLEGLNHYNMGVWSLGIALADDTGLARLSWGAAAGAGFASAVLRTVNILSRRTPTSVMRAHRGALEKGPLSSRDLDRVERDLLAVAQPIQPVVLSLPWIVGSGIAFRPALDSKSTKREQTSAVIVGSFLGFIGLLTVLTPDIVTSYRRDRQVAGFEVVSTLGETTLRYRF